MPILTKLYKGAMLVKGPDLDTEMDFKRRFGGSLGIFYEIDTWGYEKKTSCIRSRKI